MLRLIKRQRLLYGVAGFLEETNGFSVLLTPSDAARFSRRGVDQLKVAQVNATGCFYPTTRFVTGRFGVLDTNVASFDGSTVFFRVDLQYFAFLTLIGTGDYADRIALPNVKFRSETFLIVAGILLLGHFKFFEGTPD